MWLLKFGIWTLSNPKERTPELISELALLFILFRFDFFLLLILFVFSSLQPSRVLFDLENIFDQMPKKL